MEDVFGGGVAVDLSLAHARIGCLQGGGVRQRLLFLVSGGFWMFSPVGFWLLVVRQGL